MLHNIQETLESLLDPDPDVRKIAVSTLGHLGKGQPQVIEALLPLLSDYDSDVRQATVNALGHLGEGQPQVIEALLPSSLTLTLMFAKQQSMPWDT